MGKQNENVRIVSLYSGRLTPDALASFIQFFPGADPEPASMKGYVGYGCLYNRQPVGAILAKIDEANKKAELLSFYIMEENRGRGLGTKLFDKLLSDEAMKGVAELSVSLCVPEDRFGYIWLCQQGFMETEELCVRYTLSGKDVKHAAKIQNEKLFDRKKAAGNMKCLSDLGQKEIATAQKKLAKEYVETYKRSITSAHPDHSFVYMEDNIPTAVVLIGGDGSGNYSIDYVNFIEHKVYDCISILNVSVSQIADEIEDDGRLSFMAVTSFSERLFRMITGFSGDEITYSFSNVISLVRRLCCQTSWN